MYVFPAHRALCSLLALMEFLHNSPSFKNWNLRRTSQHVTRGSPCARPDALLIRPHVSAQSSHRLGAKVPEGLGGFINLPLLRTPALLPVSFSLCSLVFPAARSKNAQQEEEEQATHEEGGEFCFLSITASLSPSADMACFGFLNTEHLTKSKTTLFKMSPAII